MTCHLRLLCLAVAATLNCGTAVAREPINSGGIEAMGRKAAPVRIFDTIYKLCRTREGELLLHNDSIMDLSMQVARASGVAQQKAAIDDLELRRRLLVVAEESWQRMSCMELLHGTGASPGR